MRKKCKREECIGCMYEGEAVQCAAMELAWAWYELKKAVCGSHCKVEAPEPCDLRDVRDGML